MLVLYSNLYTGKPSYVNENNMNDGEKNVKCVVVENQEVEDTEVRAEQAEDKVEGAVVAVVDMHFDAAIVHKEAAGVHIEAAKNNLRKADNKTAEGAVVAVADVHIEAAWVHKEAAEDHLEIAKDHIEAASDNKEYLANKYPKIQ